MRTYWRIEYRNKSESRLPVWRHLGSEYIREDQAEKDAAEIAKDARTGEVRLICYQPFLVKHWTPEEKG